jgi:hypothetical protein
MTLALVSDIESERKLPRASQDQGAFISTRSDRAEVDLVGRGGVLLGVCAGLDLG